MRLLLKGAAFLVVAAVILVGAAVTFVWMTIPVNAPWKSMLQQVSLLPEWLDPPVMSADQVETRLVGPDGYGVSLFATGIGDARGLYVTSAGDVLVSSPRDGQVVLLAADRDGDGAADGRRQLLGGLNRPNGLAFGNGYLYVAEEDGVGRVTFAAGAGALAGTYERIIDELPPGGNHWRKTIKFGPDDLLYLTVGSSCNVCVEEDPRRAAMLRFTPDGEFVDAYATGLRNSAGFDWSPATGALYATDNGRDLLGDDFPPCELNEVVEGGFYGWPFANGDLVADPDLGDGQQAVIAASIPPVHAFAPHNAPLGIAFLRSRRHAPAYRQAAVVALHGSWNRTEKDGYKVVSLHFPPSGSSAPIEERDFLTGFLAGDQAIGRPTDVAEGPDGSVYVSDDFGSAVYRITYGADGDAAIAAPSGTGGSRYDPAGIPAADRETALANGPAVFESQDCGVCHAASPDGTPAQVELDGLSTRYGVEELAEYLATPQPPMPPFQASVEQRRELAIHLLESY